MLSELARADQAVTVRALYRGVLERDPDDDAVAYWLGQLERGMDLGEVVSRFVNSPERAHLAARLWRAPDLAPFGSSSLGEAAGAMTIVDVGAQALDGEADVHQPLLDSGRATVIGFEPLESEAEVRRRDGWTMLPYAVGDGSMRTFHETAWGPTSSLYEPDLAVMGDFDGGMVEAARVQAAYPVQTVRMDDALVGVVPGPVDFLKLDVQGAEVDVFRGAPRTLAEVLVVHTEALFHPLYRDQPLFADIFTLLRAQRFDLFDLPRVERYWCAEGVRTAPARRALWADALFIPSRDRLDGLDEARTLRLAWIMHDVYGALDFVGWLLARLDRRLGTSRAQAYQAMLD